MLAADANAAARGRGELVQAFGPIDAEAGPWPFDQTDYYRRETGPEIRRFFVSFMRLVDPAQLPRIKRTTNDIEATLARAYRATGPPRPINLDPGYVAPDKLVLATTKNRAHRIYLDAGIYAEVTLRYENRQWRAWPWTYPDYAAETYHAFFIAVRHTLHEQLRRETRANG